MLTNFFDKFRAVKNKKGEISPFLFLYDNSELFHSELISNIKELLKHNNIDEQSLFVLPETEEALKIGEVKTFLSQWDIRPRFAFQVFVIENISRMTLGAQNACLKFFEEPWEGNIIFLTNSSESWILETILSRVQIQDMRKWTQTYQNDFYLNLIEKHVSWASDELVRYFFSWKYEKNEYIDFLTTIIAYISRTGKHISLLDELHEDIGGILHNNLSARYITDKYIMKLWA